MRHKSTIALNGSLFVMGLSGITGQIVLLREFLVSFLGNELTIGVILGNWLILEAIGSFFIGRYAENAKRRIEIYVLIQLVFSAAFPGAVYLCRVFKTFVLATPGEGLGLGPIFYSSFLILIPVTVSHGALFTYGCKIYSALSRQEAPSVGKVYILETLGSTIGGIVTTFVLIQFLNSFEIAFAVSLTNALISVFILLPRGNASDSLLRRGLLLASILLTLVYLIFFLSPLSTRLHLSSISSQWKGLNLIHNENSIYGNVTVTRRGEQYTFFIDGVPVITAPVPDIGYIEDFVHFSMLMHERPETVLILSGGAGGMINETLKHPVKRVDYVELDPLLLRLVQRFPTPLTEQELSDRRVRIHFTDGRFFLRKTSDSFDMIFVGLSAPQELQTNRFFTEEFFSTAKAKMNSGGIISLSLPGSFTYLSRELRDLNGCLLDTLKKVFRHVRVIPGDVNLYLASDSPDLANVSAAEMNARLERRKIRASLFSPAYVKYRLDERWMGWFMQSMEGRNFRVNSDFKPVGLFLNLSYWNALFSPYLGVVFRWFEDFRLEYAIIFAAAFGLFLSSAFAIRSQFSRYCLPYAIFCSGIADMMLDLAIIYCFQAVYGFLYFQIGLLITIFMVGVAVSSLYVTRRLERIRRDRSVFILTELWVISFSLILPLALSVPSNSLQSRLVHIGFFVAFYVMSFLCGTLVGLQFPLATKIYLDAANRTGALSETAGLLYASDLAGGFLGGVAGGVFLLPLLGLGDACLAMAIIKTSSLLLFILFLRVTK